MYRVSFLSVSLGHCQCPIACSGRSSRSR